MAPWFSTKHSKRMAHNLPDRRKLQGYREGGGVSDGQWNDVLGVLKVQGVALDRAYLEEWARELGLTDLLRRALDDAGLA